MVDAKYRYQVEINGRKDALDRVATPTRALDRANKAIKNGRRGATHVRVIDLANGRVLGESRDGSPIRKLKD